jgi:hypothetical protein
VSTYLALTREIREHPWAAIRKGPAHIGKSCGHERLHSWDFGETDVVVFSRGCDLRDINKVARVTSSSTPLEESWKCHWITASFPVKERPRERVYTA